MTMIGPKAASVEIRGICKLKGDAVRAGDNRTRGEHKEGREKPVSAVSLPRPLILRPYTRPRL